MGCTQNPAPSFVDSRLWVGRCFAIYWTSFGFKIGGTNAQRVCLESQGDLVSRSIMEILGATISLIIWVISILTKSP